MWNQLFGLMKALVPREVLANAALMQSLSVFSLPIIRVTDAIVGATNAMRVDAYVAESAAPAGGGAGTSSGPRVRFSVTHADLEQCVGLATAAFALELMRTDAGGEVAPGVYYPADLPAESRARILSRIRQGACLWEFEVS